MDCGPERVKDWDQGSRLLLELSRRQGQALAAGNLETVEELGEERRLLARTLDRLPPPGPDRAPAVRRRLEEAARQDRSHRLCLEARRQESRRGLEEEGRWRRAARAYRGGGAPEPAAGRSIDA